MVWDTNRYYADLGVSPYASRKELREAYQRRNGHSSVRLTFIIQQLLDPEVRAAYDATPCFSLFMDYEVETWMRRRAAQEVTESVLLGDVTPEDLEAEARAQKLIDRARLARQPKPTSRQALPTGWSFAYYLWMTWGSRGGHTQDLMHDWQKRVVTAFAERGITRQIAVGFVSGVGVHIDTVGYRTVVFLGDQEQPTDALARWAASSITA